MESQTERLRRAAENQALFREVNERIDEMARGFDPAVPYAQWLCECAHVSCAEQIPMSIEEYEAVRAHPTRFAVAPHAAHVVPEAERVVATTERYWVVEKVGSGAERAAELDARSS